MKSKFYYNGHLIRTSAHDDTHAVIYEPTVECIACRTNEENAQAFIRTECNRWNQLKQNYQNAIKAIENGKPFYWVHEGRKRWQHFFKEYNTIEYYSKKIEEIEKELTDIEANWKVVPIEKH